jgi:hypothetical protein
VSRRHVGAVGTAPAGRPGLGSSSAAPADAATSHWRKGTEQFLGFYDVHVDCLRGLFRRRKRVLDVSEAFRRLAPAIAGVGCSSSWITCTTSMIIRTSWVCSADFISTRCGRPTEASWLNAIAAHFGVTKRATLTGSGRSGLPRRGHGGASMPKSGAAAPLKRQSCRPRSRNSRNLFPGTAVARRFCLPPGGVPEPGMEKEAAMLWTIVAILLVLWALGMITSYTIGGVIHLLLDIAVIVVVFQFISGRRSAWPGRRVTC